MVALLSVQPIARLFDSPLLRESFLLPIWGDIGAIASILGLILTFLGLWFAILQIKKTRSAADAAKLAAENAATESLRSFERYSSLAARRLVDLIKIYVRKNYWCSAAERLDDLAKHASDLGYLKSQPDRNWIILAAQSRDWSQTLGRKSDGTQMANSQIQKWNDFLLDIESQIDAMIGSFQLETSGKSED